MSISLFVLLCIRWAFCCVCVCEYFFKTRLEVNSVKLLEIISLPNSEDEDTAVIGMDSNVRSFSKGDHHSKG